MAAKREQGIRGPRFRAVLAVGVVLVLAGCKGLALAIPGGSQLGMGDISGALPGQGGGVLLHATGTVLGLDHQPAAGVTVSGYLVSNNAGGLVSNNAGGLVSNNATAFTTTTDAAGHFDLPVPASVLSSTSTYRTLAVATTLTIEARQASNVKALEVGISPSASDVSLQLAYTGTITGRVTAPGTTVTDFLGVDVFIPGTIYDAKANQDGTFEIDDVPVGAFELAATQIGLGTAFETGVTVTSNHTSAAPDLALSISAPVIASISPPNGGPGTVVTITGDHFGASEGDLFGVTFGGATVASPDRISDQEILATVPDGVTAGDVVVSVEGHASNSLPFIVLHSLALVPGDLDLAAGATAAVAVQATDVSGQPVSDPAVAWAIAGQGATLVSTQSELVVAGTGSGDSVLSGTSGELVASASIHVTDFQALGGASASVTTFAGSGTAGSGDGPLGQAQFDAPTALALDPTDSSGSMYVLDNGNIRELSGGNVVTIYSPSISSPFIVQAENPLSLFCLVTGVGGLGFDSVDGLRQVFGGPDLSFTPDISSLGVPEAMTADASGTVYVSIASGSVGLLARIALVTDPTVGPSGVPTGTPFSSTTTWIGNPTQGAYRALAVSPSGVLYSVDPNLPQIDRIAADGSAQPFAGGPTPGQADGVGVAAQFRNPTALAFDPSGNLFVTDTGNESIRAISPAGAVSTIAGTGAIGDANGPGSAATFDQPRGIAAGPDGHLFVADQGNYCVREITY